MIKLTLPDGTRTQIDASEITDVEPVEGGSLLDPILGERLLVLQDARIPDARLKIEWAGPLKQADQFASSLITLAVVLGGILALAIGGYVLLGGVSAVTPASSGATIPSQSGSQSQ